jgi:hypothetical protein
MSEPKNEQGRGNDPQNLNIERLISQGCIKPLVESMVVTYGVRYIVLIRGVDGRKRAGQGD